MEEKSHKSLKETAKIAKLEAEKEELLSDLQRTRADFENFRKQVDLQKEQAKKLATDATVMKLLPLLDDMSRAIGANPEALLPLQKTLEKSMNDLNLVRINAEPGTDFNPELHNAISMDDSSEGDHEVIATELMPGYLYQGAVLRPAMVHVKRI